MLAKVILGLAISFFIWYTFCVIALPFFETTHAIVAYFPGPKYTLIIPALFGLIFIGSLLTFTIIVIYTENFCNA